MNESAVMQYQVRRHFPRKWGMHKCGLWSWNSRCSHVKHQEPLAWVRFHASV